MTPRLSGQFFILGLVFCVLKCLLGIARQWSREKFAILSLKPRNHVRIAIQRTCAIIASEVKKKSYQAEFLTLLKSRSLAN